MKCSRLLFVIPLVLFIAGCAVFTGGSNEYPDETPRQHVCSDTPKNAVTTFLLGFREFSLSLLKSVVPENVSLWAVFGNNNEERGQEVVKQITAHPEIAGANRSCSCSLYSITDTKDPQEKVVVIKRVSLIEDDVREYTRAFSVRFVSGSNCIISVDSIDTKWERM
ncbi:MAG: hypothetical protein NUV60_01530 [Patescibacteria group bacterium]|nr:hypothetical protein [Patescibacteria group bacterium]